MLKKFSDSDAVRVICALASSGLIKINGPVKMGDDPICNLDLASFDAIYLKSLYFHLTHHKSGNTELETTEKEARSDF